MKTEQQDNTSDSSEAIVSPTNSESVESTSQTVFPITEDASSRSKDKKVKTDKPKRDRSGRRKIGLGLKIKLIIFFLLLIAIAGGVAAYMMGYLYGGVKKPEQEVKLDTVVCDSNIVGKYNSLAFITDTDTGRANFDSLADDIKSKPDYADDATCQTILFLHARSTNNLGAMQNAASSIRRLNGQGVFANNDILGALSIIVMEQLVDQANSANAESANDANSGGGE